MGPLVIVHTVWPEVLSTFNWACSLDALLSSFDWSWQLLMSDNLQLTKLSGSGLLAWLLPGLMCALCVKAEQFQEEPV